MIRWPAKKMKVKERRKVESGFERDQSTYSRKYSSGSLRHVASGYGPGEFKFSVSRPDVMSGLSSVGTSEISQDHDINGPAFL